MSSSLASSSSFGRLESTTLIGSAANMTNTDFQLGIISSSTQLESEIFASIKSKKGELAQEKLYVFYQKEPQLL